LADISQLFNQNQHLKDYLGLTSFIVLEELWPVPIGVATTPAVDPLRLLDAIPAHFGLVELSGS